MADVPPLLAGIRLQMKHLAERQRVISGNIANADTPGFKAKEVAAPDFGSLLGGGGPGKVARPRVEITGRMAALGARAPVASGIQLDRNISETKPDGNNVTLEDQLLKMGQVQADFAAMTNLYRKQQALLKTALGKGA